MLLENYKWVLFIPMHKIKRSFSGWINYFLGGEEELGQRVRVNLYTLQMGMQSRPAAVKISVEVAQ